MSDEHSGKRIAAHQLLDSLLSSLVAHWGLDTVQARLAELAGHSHDVTKVRATRRSLSKATAQSILERSRFPIDKHQELLEVARAFDEKRFLPTIGDAREFMAMRGRGDAILPASRAEAFRPILKELLRMSNNELQQLIEHESHQGPVSLRPISDAISEAGKNRRAGDLDDEQLPRA